MVFFPQPHPQFGLQIPHGDPAWYQGAISPYHQKHHSDFRILVRSFVEKYVTPYVDDWENESVDIKQFWHNCANNEFFNFSAGLMGLWPTEFIGECPFPWDTFMEAIMFDEWSRCGADGPGFGFVTQALGLGPVANFGNVSQKAEIVNAAIRGEKACVLAITEPYGGSDVSGIRTTAELSDDGEHYIVNGEKKWITGAIYADYLTTAVRTGGAGGAGVSVLIIPTTLEGVNRTKMTCMGAKGSGTTYVVFDDVKVPKHYLLGEEGSGFKYIMCK